jgi:hypothetical protein
MHSSEHAILSIVMNVCALFNSGAIAAVMMDHVIGNVSSRSYDPIVLIMLKQAPEFHSLGMNL